MFCSSLQLTPQIEDQSKIETLTTGTEPILDITLLWFTKKGNDPNNLSKFRAFE